MKIAVVGAGGAGLVTAWLLDGAHEVTLYEREARLGGHAHTIPLTVGGKRLAVDAGFEFVSAAMFPTLLRLLSLLDVPLATYPMRVTMFNTRDGAGYLMPPFHGWRIFPSGFAPHKIADLLLFTRILRATAPLMNTRNTTITVEQWLDQLEVPADFRARFMYPYLQVGWGVSQADIQAFAAYDVFKYSVLNTPATLIPHGWEEIVGGTQTYTQAVARSFKSVRVRLDTGVAAIERASERANEGGDGGRQGGYLVRDTHGAAEVYDHVVLATNANQAAVALAPLAGVGLPGAAEMVAQLRAFRYFETTIALHGDHRLMPPQRRHWSTVNIRYDGEFSQFSMYRPRKGAPPVFKSWVTHDAALPDPLYATAHYLHPHVDVNYFALQKRLQPLQGRHSLWLAGMYMVDVDCHESVVRSAINVARRLAPQSARLRLLTQGAPQHDDE